MLKRPLGELLNIFVWFSCKTITNSRSVKVNMINEVQENDICHGSLAPAVALDHELF